MEEIIGEQPSSVEMTQCAAAQDSGEQLSIDNGSLGKFKDTETLLSAYNNLQAEFTRKCQKLSELEKSQNIEQSNEKIDEISNETSQEIEKIYKLEDWDKKVLEFLNKNENAKPYAREIASEIMNDETLAKNENALSLAWAKIVEKNYKSPKELESDDFIDSFISSSDKVKQKVLDIIAKDIANQKLPKIVGNLSSGQINLPKFIPPKDMADAKEMARKLFE